MDAVIWSHLHRQTYRTLRTLTEICLPEQSTQLGAALPQASHTARNSRRAQSSNDFIFDLVAADLSRHNHGCNQFQNVPALRCLFARRPTSLFVCSWSCVGGFKKGSRHKHMLKAPLLPYISFSLSMLLMCLYQFVSSSFLSAIAFQLAF